MTEDVSQVVRLALAKRSRLDAILVDGDDRRQAS